MKGEHVVTPMCSCTVKGSQIPILVATYMTIRNFLA